MRITLKKANSSDRFLFEELPKFYVKIIQSELQKKIFLQMQSYIETTYGINKRKLFALIGKNIQVENYSDYIIIGFNTVNNIQTKIGNISLNSLLQLINDGNFDVKGTNAITKSKTYILNNIVPIRRYLRFKAIREG